MSEGKALRHKTHLEPGTRDLTLGVSLAWKKNSWVRVSRRAASSPTSRGLRVIPGKGNKGPPWTQKAPPSIHSPKSAKERKDQSAREPSASSSPSFPDGASQEPRCLFPPLQRGGSPRQGPVKLIPRPRWQRSYCMEVRTLPNDHVHCYTACGHVKTDVTTPGGQGLFLTSEKRVTGTRGPPCLP